MEELTKEDITLGTIKRMIEDTVRSLIKDTIKVPNEEGREGMINIQADCQFKTIKERLDNAMELHKVKSYTELSNLVHIDKTNLSKMVNGKVTPSDKLINNIVDIFGGTPSYWRYGIIEGLYFPRLTELIKTKGVYVTPDNIDTYTDTLLKDLKNLEGTINYN